MSSRPEAHGSVYCCSQIRATAYPGTASAEILETLAPCPEVYTKWAPNEKVALEVAIGASLAGARAICSMKHVGLNVASDPLMTASYTGVRGGLVIADDLRIRPAALRQVPRRSRDGGPLGLATQGHPHGS